MTISEFAKRIIAYTEEVEKNESSSLLPDHHEKINALKAQLKKQINSGRLDTDDVWDFVRKLPYNVCNEVHFYYYSLRDCVKTSESCTNYPSLEKSTKRARYTNEINGYPYKSKNIVDLLAEVEKVHKERFARGLSR